MKAAINIDISYEQVLSLVRKLPYNQKLKLSKELEKDGVGTKLTALLKSFRTDELTEEMVQKEVETVRRKRYDERKKR